MAYQFRVLTAEPVRLNVVSSKLGPDAATKYTMTEVGKAMKMAGSGNYVLCADGDEVEGFMDSLEPMTQDGFSFGGVANPSSGQRVECKVGGATVLVFGDLIVAGVQAAVGTNSLPVVKKGTPTKFLWRVISLFGAGAIGSTVVIERI